MKNQTRKFFNTLKTFNYNTHYHSSHLSHLSKLSNLNSLVISYSSSFSFSDNYKQKSNMNKKEIFPLEEESQDNLLRQLNRLNSNNNSESKSESMEGIMKNIYFEQKNNLLFITTTDSHSINQLSYGSIIKLTTENKETKKVEEHFAQVVVLKEKIITLILLSSFNIKRHLITKYEKNVVLNSKDSPSSTSLKNSDLLENVVVNNNYIQEYIQLISNKKESLLTSNLSKKMNSNSKVLVNSQLKTNQVLIDYVNPLIKGNMFLMKGENNNGQEEFMFNIIQEFKEGIIYIITHNNKLVRSIKEKIKSQNLKIEIMIGLHSNPQENSEVKNYLIQRLLIEKLKNENPEKEILVVYDNYLDFFFSNNYFINHTQLYLPPMNTVNEIYELCGNYKQGGSITTIIVSWIFN